MQLPSLDPASRHRVLLGLAANPAAPPDVLSRLIAMRGAAFEIARRDDLTAALAQAIVALLEDPDPVVRHTAARHHADTPAELLERSVAEHGDNHEARLRLVEHPNFPKAAFARFAASANARLRCTACHDPNLPADLVARLAADPESPVRRMAAAHSNLPVECLPALLTDEGPGVVQSAGSSPVLPVPWMIQLLDDGGL